MMRLPKELDLPQMKDHQMFDRPRIVQLQNELQDKFKSLKVLYSCTWEILISLSQGVEGGIEGGVHMLVLNTW